MNRLDKKNAMNYDILNGLLKAIDNVERSKARVVIITGNDDIFSSGIDLNFLTGQGNPPEANLPDLRVSPLKYKPLSQPYVNPSIHSSLYIASYHVTVFIPLSTRIVFLYNSKISPQQPLTGIEIMFQPGSTCIVRLSVFQAIIWKCFIIRQKSDQYV